MERHRHVEAPADAPGEEPTLEVMTDQEMIHQPELSRREEVPAPSPVFGDEDAFDAAFGEYEAPPPAAPAGIREAAPEAVPEALPEPSDLELPEPVAGFPQSAEPEIAPPEDEPFRSTDEQVLEEDSYVFGRPRFDDQPANIAEEEEGGEAVADFLEETTGDTVASEAVEEPWEPVEATPPEDRVRTETMAEIYFQQGLFVEALDIYHHLAAIRPGDRIIADRVREIEQRIDAAAHPTAAPVEVEPMAVASQASPREAEALRTLKEWLARLKTRY